MDNLLLVQHICTAQLEIQIYQIIILIFDGHDDDRKVFISRQLALSPLGGITTSHSLNQ